MKSSAKKEEEEYGPKSACLLEELRSTVRKEYSNSSQMDVAIFYLNLLLQSMVLSKSHSSGKDMFV